MNWRKLPKGPSQMIYKYALQIKAAQAKLYRLKKEKAKAQQIMLIKKSRKRRSLR